MKIFCLAILFGVFACDKPEENKAQEQKTKATKTTKTKAQDNFDSFKGSVIEQMQATKNFAE
jgi:hypothetical protein